MKRIPKLIFADMVFAGCALYISFLLRFDFIIPNWKSELSRIIERENG